MWRNGAGDQHVAPAVQVRATRREDVADAVRRAGAEGRTVRAVGAGHSFSDIALTNGYQLSLDGMDQVLEADPASGLGRGEAGDPDPPPEPPPGRAGAAAGDPG